MNEKLKTVIHKVDSFKETPTLCYLPFMHMEADAKGWLKPCCMAEGPVRKEGTNEPYNLNNGDNITNAFNSPDMQKLRQDFLDGKKPEICKKCWDEEDAGLESKRITWAHQFTHRLPELRDIFSKDITENDIAYLDLKLGTICNLKCRICGSWSSSKWAQEEIEIDVKFHGLKKQDAKKSNAYYYLKQGEWPRKSPQFWEDLKGILPNVKHLEFTGGEPWMIKEHFAVLETLIDSGHAKNINIHYNTNGTQLPKHEFHNILPHFKHCRISFSIDDIGDKFEYQRYGAKWNEVNNNIQYICENKANNMETEICTTLNLFNFHNLTDVADYVKEIDLDSWYLNLMHLPKHFNIMIHTPEVKDIIANKLRAYDWQELIDKNFSNVTEIESFISYMYSEDISKEKDGEEYLENMLHTMIYKVDSVRNKTLNEVDSVLAQYIGYDYSKFET